MFVLGKLLIHLVEGAFILGIIGSAVVVAITFVEDIRNLSGGDE